MTNDPRPRSYRRKIRVDVSRGGEDAGRQPFVELRWLRRSRWRGVERRHVRIDDSVKREVLTRTDIAEYIGQTVTLRKRGNSLVGLCPFHAEKTPSFHVHPDRGFFKCFGCDAHGDVIHYLRLTENLTFPDALRVLAKRAGVVVEDERPAAARARSVKEDIYHANDVAARYFSRVLSHDPSAAPARRYCEQRGLQRATIEAFHLGYAPDRWDGLVGELRACDVDLGVAVTAGLVKVGQSGGHYDVYRGRLMFPTYATTGEVIAFGGRTLGTDEPKYINTSTTPVYTKGRFLFALNVARRPAAKAEAIVVVEGYLDCITLHQAGFANTVASLGTAFTSEQAHELQKVTPKVYLCFDADGAGQAATEKSIETLVHAGCKAHIVVLPAGHDPDTYVQDRGAEAFRTLIATAVPFAQYKIDSEIERKRVTESSAPAGRAEVARWAEGYIQEHLPQEEWDRWRVYVAGRLNVSADDLRRSRLVARSKHFTPRSTVGEAGARAGRHILPGSIEAPSFEHDVLAIVLEEPVLLREYADRVRPERFEHVGLRRIYTVLADRRQELLQPSDVRALFSDDDDASATLDALRGVERSVTVRFASSEERRAFLDRVVERFRTDDLQRRYQELDARLNRLHAAGDCIPQELRDEIRDVVVKLKG